MNKLIRTYLYPTFLLEGRLLNHRGEHPMALHLWNRRHHRVDREELHDRNQQEVQNVQNRWEDRNVQNHLQDQNAQNHPTDQNVQNHSEDQYCENNQTAERHLWKNQLEVVHLHDNPN